MLVAVAGLVAACCAVLACCVGAWVFLGPVNYSGCGTERPDNISKTDLVGTYETRDGARLELQTGNLLMTTELATDFMDGRLNLSGPGEGHLLSAHANQVDIDLSLTAERRSGSFSAPLHISGTRQQPWLYWFDGDPDGCNLYRFNRIA